MSNTLKAHLTDIIGCFRAAEVEGLAEALAQSTDTRLVDLVNRRLMYALEYALDSAETALAAIEAAQVEQAAPAPQQPQGAADALNTLLWLYRRLPRGYGRPPAVERTINALSENTGVQVAEFLAERDDSAQPVAPDLRKVAEAVREAARKICFDWHRKHNEQTTVAIRAIDIDAIIESVKGK